MQLILIFLLFVLSHGFYMKNENAVREAEVFEINKPIASMIRSKENSIEFFGQSWKMPAWMNAAAEKTKEMFESAMVIFGKGTPTSRKLSDGLMTSLRKDEATRIWFAVYLNIFVLILIYLFITFKLALLSLSEEQLVRKEKNAFSSHVAFDSPDLNFPLTSITIERARSNDPVPIGNSAADFEIAHESGSSVIPNVTPLDFDAISSSRDE